MRLAAAVVLATGCTAVFEIHHVDFHDAPADTQSAGLVAYYPMDSIPGRVLCMPDAVGTNNGTCFGGEPTLVASPLGSGFSFDGTFNIHVAQDSSIDLPQLSVSMWFELASMPVDSECPVNRVYQATDNSWQICITAATMYYRVGLGTALNAAFAPQPGVWHQAAFTYDGSTFTGWLDGIAVGSGVASSVPYGNEPMVVGTDIDGTTPAAPFSGALDDVRLYNRALTPAEIQALATRP